MSTDPRARAWIEVDERALGRNFEVLRAQAGASARVLPVVKADAYGLGVARVVQALERLDPWGYGVANVDEGADLRRLEVDRPILVLSPLTAGGEVIAVAERLTPGVSSVEEVARLRGEAERQGTTVAVHVEIDTGMGRAGFVDRAVADWGEAVRAEMGDRVRWEGVYTHFHSAHQAGGPEIDGQTARFDVAVDHLRKVAGRSVGWIEHLCNSAGLLRRPGLARDLVRPGIFLYGGGAGADLPAPDPVVSMRGRVTRVARVPAGASVGYDAVYRAQREERWATVDLGYADGLPRPIENRGFALVEGTRVPIVGRISMGLVVVDTTDLAEEWAGVGSQVTFLGTDGDETITVDEVAGHSGRSPYEVLTGLSSFLPRIWT